MKQAIHHGNIGIAAGAAVLIADVLLFARGSEAALQAGGLLAMFVGVVVTLALQERARRHRDRNQ
jgi:ABC-type cobalamin transport system permease subunit